MNSKNTKLPFSLDEYSSEFHLGVHCSWRLQKGCHPITSSCEPNGLYSDCFIQILEKNVTDIVIDPELGDLRIVFDDVILVVFCDQTGHEDAEYYEQSDSNWFIQKRGEDWIEVEKGNELKIY